MLPLFVLWFSCCLCFFYTFEHFVLSYCLNCQVAKMADDVQEDIVNALNTIASSTERSSNMKKEFKHTIYESVSTLRKLFLKLKEVRDGKSRKITELQMLNLMFLWPCIMNWPYKTTNVMHLILFIRQILLSFTCFEYQVLIFRRTQLYMSSIWYRHSL